jgi:hypothetical protein
MDDGAVHDCGFRPIKAGEVQEVALVIPPSGKKPMSAIKARSGRPARSIFGSEAGVLCRPFVT